MEIRTCSGPNCPRGLPPGSRSDQRFRSQGCRLRAFRRGGAWRSCGVHLLKRLRTLPDTETLSEKYERAREHRASLDPGEDLRAYSDFGDVPGDEDPGDDPEDYGIHVTERDDDSGQRWKDEYTLQTQIERISDAYHRRAEPYLQHSAGIPGSVQPSSSPWRPSGSSASTASSRPTSGPRLMSGPPAPNPGA